MPPICLVVLTVFSKYSITSSSNLTFFTNNIKGLQPSIKRIKLMEYFKIQLTHSGLLFSASNNSNVKNENSWTNDFNGWVFFSHGASNSCGILIAYLVKHPLSLINRKQIKLREFDSWSHV